MKSERLRKIREENARFERQSPYNFCDKWCERCIVEKQNRCRLYLDEFERKVTCMAHGKEPDDLEITGEVMRRQYEGMEENMEKFMEEHGIDPDELDEAPREELDKQEELAENDPLNKTAGQYYRKARELLKETFYKKEADYPYCRPEFEIAAWYHILLPAKLYRALCGFYEQSIEGDIALGDAVAQFDICKKAIDKSTEALRKISDNLHNYQKQISELIALLSNIHSRIELLEGGIR